VTHMGRSPLIANARSRHSHKFLLQPAVLICLVHYAEDVQLFLRMVKTSACLRGFPASRHSLFS
jgi:hypothetical protein